MKRPAEVLELRSIYGDALIVLGLQASMQTRREELIARIKPPVPSKSEPEVRRIVEDLVDRDLDGRSTGPYGQSMLKTFPMADVFLNLEGDLSGQVQRLLDLLFCNPAYSVPTVDEHGMFLAYTASTRSPELGLKACIVRGGSVVSLGANTHPTDARGGADPGRDRGDATALEAAITAHHMRISARRPAPVDCSCHRSHTSLHRVSTNAGRV